MKKIKNDTLMKNDRSFDGDESIHVFCQEIPANDPSNYLEK